MRLISILIWVVIGAAGTTLIYDLAKLFPQLRFLFGLVVLALIAWLVFDEFWIEHLRFPPATHQAIFGFSLVSILSGGLVVWLSL
jgi:hypothetical protein